MGRGQAEGNEPRWDRLPVPLVRHIPRRALAALAVATLLVALAGPADQGGSRVAAQQQGQVEFSLNVMAASNVVCQSGGKPAACAVSPGSSFTLTAGINNVPASGYSAYEVDVRHPGLISKAIRYVAISQLGVTLPVVGVGTAAFRAGALTSIQQPPLPTIGYLGPLVEADFNCPATGTFKISMPVPETKVKDANGDNISITTHLQASAKVANTLLVSCIDPLDFDKDGDGCTTRQELGSNERLGGRRDPNNRWDFYDVNGDKKVNLLGDIIPVVLAFAQGPNDGGGLGPNYSLAKDRGVQIGAYPWNRAGPDGKVGLFNDILPVILQFGHSCR